MIEHAMKLLEDHLYTIVAEMLGISKFALTRVARKMKIDVSKGIIFYNDN